MRFRNLKAKGARTLGVCLALWSLAACAVEPKGELLVRCPDFSDQVTLDELIDGSWTRKIAHPPRLATVLGDARRDELVRLLKKGENPNVCLAGFSLLSFAAATGDADLVETLLQGGANADLPLDEVGESPLFKALQGHHYGIADRLVRAGADPRVAADGHQTALHLIALTPPSANASSEQLRWVRKVLDAGVSVDSRNSRGSTPPMLAAASGNHALVSLLLARKADPGLTNQRGQRAVDLARKRGFADIARELDTASATPKPPIVH